MPFAQKPSILRSSSALAAVTPKFTTAPGTERGPGHRRDLHLVAREIDPGRGEQAAQAHVDPGCGADAAAFDDRQIAALRLQIGVHHQKPVHALRLRADKLHAAKIGKRRQRRMRRAADEIDRAVAQCRVGAIDRENELE